MSTRSLRRRFNPAPISDHGFQINLPAGSLRRGARNAEARGRPDDRHGDDHDANAPEVVVPDVEHQAAERRAGNDGDEGAHLEHAVRARQLFVGKNLRQNSVRSPGLKNVACSAIRNRTA